MASGNYNWFNLHTALLLLPSWDQDFDLHAVPLPLSELLIFPLRLWERFWSHSIPRLLARCGALVVLGYAAVTLFPVSLGSGAGDGYYAALFEPSGYYIENRITMDFVSRLMKTLINEQTVLAYYLMATIFIIGHVLNPPQGHGLKRVFHACWHALFGIFTLIYLGMTLMPLSDVFPHQAPPIPNPTWLPIRTHAEVLKAPGPQAYKHTPTHILVHNPYSNPNLNPKQLILIWRSSKQHYGATIPPIHTVSSAE